MLFTQCLQYANFPLFSLQLTTQSAFRDMGWHKDTRSDGCEHTPNLSSRLKAFPPLCLFIQRCDILPWHVIKKCPRFWGSDSHCLQMSSRDRSRRGCSMMSWCWVMRVNLAPRGRGLQNFLLWHDGSSLVCPCPPLTAGHHFLNWAWPRARPSGTRRKHNVPLSGSDNPSVLTQSILAHFLFLSLALFLHLPCRGDRGIWDYLCGRVHNQAGKRSSSFSLPSAPPEWLPFAPLH